MRAGAKKAGTKGVKDKKDKKVKDLKPKRAIVAFMFFSIDRRPSMQK